MKIISILFLFTIASAYPQVNNSASLLSARNEIQLNIKSDSLSDLADENMLTFKKKSPALAILYSLLLPGMGELYAESYSSGKYFTIAEGVLWGTYIGISTYGDIQKDRYIAYAATNADVVTTGKNDDYYGIISENLNVYDYNDQKALERNFHEMYDEEKYYWSWSEQDRKNYRQMWVSSEQAYNSLQFVVGAMLLNRVASAINAVRLVSAYNKRGAAQMGWNVSFGVIEEGNVPNGLSLNFQTRF